jgi:hypothetical protein
MLFGDASGGGERGGERIWGAFRATLVPGASETGLGHKLDRSAESAAPRRAQTAEPLPSNPAPANVAPMSPASSSADLPAPAREDAIPAPPQPGTSVTPEVLPIIAKEVAKPESTFVVAPPTSIPAAVAPAAERARLIPLTPLQNIEPPDPAKAVREFKPYVAPAPRDDAALTTPSLPPLQPLSPLASPALERAPATTELLPRLLPPTPATTTLTPLAPARIEREYAPVAEPLPRVPAVAPPVAPPVPLAPATIERQYAPVAEPLPRLVPQAAPQSERELAPFVAPKIAPDPTPASQSGRDTTARPAPPELSAPSNAPYSPNVQTSPKATTQRDSPVRSERELTPRSADPGALPPASPPLPGVDSRLSGREAPGSAAPNLDLDAIRNRARNLGGDRAAEGSGPRTVFPFPTPPPEVLKSKEARIFDKALKRPDCRDAYAGMGLAAVVPLVADAITNKGCKW